MGQVRTFSILGDSVSTFEGCCPEGFAVYYEGERLAASGLASCDDTWWALLVRHLGGRVLANASYSGSMVEGEGFPAAWSPERIAALAGPDGEAPQVVVVFMGINDYGWGGARAQAAGRSRATPACVDLAQIPPQPAGLAAPGTLERFESAYARMLAAIREAYPACETWCVSLLPGREVGHDRPAFAWNLRGVPLTSYNDAIARAAAQTGARYVDACGLGFDYEAADGTHPTPMGMRQIAGLVAAAVEGRDPCETGLASMPDGTPCFGERWRSAVQCPGPCVGCPHAKGATSPWFCVCLR